MKLYYTPRSHFSRKVRILLDAYGLDVQYIDVGNVAQNEGFADNPLMKVPVLVDEKVDEQAGEQTSIFDSDHIAQYITQHHAPDDPYDVCTPSIQTLNVRAVLNGIMAAEVELILAQRTGIPIDEYVRFEKQKAAIVGGLNWLEAQTWSEAPTYVGFHLVCAWDHLVLYDLVELNYPRLRDAVAALSGWPFVTKSKPV